MQGIEIENAWAYVLLLFCMWGKVDAVSAIFVVFCVSEFCFSCRHVVDFMAVQEESQVGWQVRAAKAAWASWSEQRCYTDEGSRNSSSTTSLILGVILNSVKKPFHRNHQKLSDTEIYMIYSTLLGAGTSCFQATSIAIDAKLKPKRVKTSVMENFLGQEQAPAAFVPCFKVSNVPGNPLTSTDVEPHPYLIRLVILKHTMFLLDYVI